MDFIELTKQLLEGQRRNRAEMQGLRRELRQLRSEISVLHKSPNDVLNVDETAALLGIAGKTLRNWVSKGDFPRPDKPLPNSGGKRKGWLMKTVLEHKLSQEED